MKAFAGSPLAWTLVASLAASLAGCIVDFHPAKVCGDGYVDKLADEACDPGDPDSYAALCAALGGPPRDASACDPLTCEFVPDACDLCGNGLLDVGEQCEPGTSFGATCPEGPGVPTCKDDCTLDLSACAACGDGKLDIDEECDPAQNPGDIAAQISCPDLISPAGVSRRYGSGISTRCTSKCLWDRSNCSYCMNDQLDGVASVDFDGMITLEAEICDNNTAAPDMLDKHCRAVCGSNYSVECSYKCSPDCRAFDIAAVPPEELNCCTARGEECPYGIGTEQLLPGRVPCCWAQDHPGEPPCQQLFIPNGTIFVCR